MKKMFSIRAGRGFTLMETLLAIALVGVLLSIFLTVFVPARGLVRQALTRQESERITGILRSELSMLRGDERADSGAKSSSENQYLTTFDKGFHWLRKTSKPSSAIVVFSYRADLSKPARKDGTYPAVPAGKSVPGKDVQLVSIACPMDDPVHRDDIRDAVGPVFLVKMTQLELKSNGEYRMAGSPGVISQASAPENYVSQAGQRDAWGGVIFCRAEFYHMSPPNPARYKGKTWKKLGRPLFSANLSFRR
ncbi:MAG: type II secretion system protein [Akkermansia sp.]|nr:type II secretion system protein [Akkermansia sp.]